jgi:hypothetical protein
VRAIIKSFLFAYVAVTAAEYFVGGFYYNGPSKILLIIALMLLNLFLPALLALVSLPDRGLGYSILNFILTTVIVYVLTSFIPDYGFVATTTQSLNIFFVVIPSKHLSATWAAVVSAMVVSIVYGFLSWVTACKGKKK